MLEHLGHLGSGASCSRDPNTVPRANTSQAHRCCKDTWWSLYGTQLPRAYLIREYWVLMSADPRQSFLWGDSRRGGEATSGPLHVLFINIWMTKILANFRKTFIFCRNNAPLLSWREKHHISLGRENRRRCPLERQLDGVRQPWAWSHLLQIPVQTQSLKNCVALEK